MVSRSFGLAFENLLHREIAFTQISRGSSLWSQKQENCTRWLCEEGWRSAYLWLLDKPKVTLGDCLWWEVLFAELHVKEDKTGSEKVFQIGWNAWRCCRHDKVQNGQLFEPQSNPLCGLGDRLQVSVVGQILCLMHEEKQGPRKKAMKKLTVFKNYKFDFNRITAHATELFV